jgi:hypothetical protein
MASKLHWDLPYTPRSRLAEGGKARVGEHPFPDVLDLPSLTVAVRISPTPDCQSFYHSCWSIFGVSPIPPHDHWNILTMLSPHLMWMPSRPRSTPMQNASPHPLLMPSSRLCLPAYSRFLIRSQLLIRR